MATTVTLATLLERLTENLWPGQFPVKITATGGAVGTFIAATAAYSSGHANAYDGVGIYMLSTTDALAPQGEFVKVTSAGFTPASGTFAVSPAWTVSPASGDVGLFLYGLPPDNIIDAINDIQRTMKVPRFLPLSLITDGDMETTGVGNWTDVGAPTTKAKITTAAETLLRQALDVAAGLDAGVTTANIAVEDTDTVYLSVPIRTQTGSVKVILYNATASSIIKSVTVSATPYTEVRFSEGVPASCKNVTVRLLGGEAGSRWRTGWVSLLTNNKVYSLPSAIVDSSEFIQAYYLYNLHSGTSNDTLRMWDQELRVWPSELLPRDWRGASPNRIAIDTPLYGPIFVSFRSALAVLSALTDTTEIPEELLVEGALGICLKQLAARARSPQVEAKLKARQARAETNYFSMLESKGLGSPTVVYSGVRRSPAGRSIADTISYPAWRSIGG